ncbi:hypothetical protein [uncultured Chloroflexus sp.]|uniref:hypothetical protein n=1 Tax=uncultured Chloroflexus sp. TaxID=214040 RepID=UPI002620255A|nr:hypothetical protein [uncultured Chloroflexus sp.]
MKPAPTFRLDASAASRTATGGLGPGCNLPLLPAPDWLGPGCSLLLPPALTLT